MKGFEITVRCTSDKNHAKKLRIKEESKDYVLNLAALLDGTSSFYVLKPGPLSPIGKCATCGGQVVCVVEDVEFKEDE